VNQEPQNRDPDVQNLNFSPLEEFYVELEVVHFLMQIYRILSFSYFEKFSIQQILLHHQVFSCTICISYEPGFTEMCLLILNIQIIF
jgi:hypothetical protein